MPELFAALQRNERRRSKSFVTPSFQMMNVFPFAGLDSVVSPRIAPSLTDHSRGSPSQSARSFPLKSRRMSGGSAGGAAAANATWNAPTPTTRNIRLRIIELLQEGAE